MKGVGGRFTDQVAVITGAGSGIGLAVAQRLNSEGAKVSARDISEPALKAGAKFYAQRVLMDQSDERAVAQAVEQTIREFGRIDILVVSAGITGPNAALVDYSTVEWRKVIDVNVNGIFYVNRAVVPHMAKNNYGRIVNIASVAGKEGNPNASAYSASKAAVIGLTKSLGKELAKDGVTVNVITPAVIDTPILAQASDSHIAYMRSKIPMERFGQVAEVAALVCW